MQDLTNEFPALKNCIYANTAASGLMHRGLLQWRNRHDLQFLNGGSEMKLSAMQQLIPETRKTIARFFNCKNSNVALIQNFSLGLNVLLEGLNKQGKILLLDHDYPSVNWPFEDRGFQIEYAKIDGNLEANIWQQLQKGNFAILALSLVQWLDGIKIDFDFLKKLKSEFPDMIIIADGTQFCGTESFDFEDSAIDILGVSAYKWMLAGYGNGFMLFKDGIEQKFKVKAIGFGSTNTDKDLRDSVRFAKRFEPGHLDTLNFGSLKYSLLFLDKIGMDRISEHNVKLASKAKKEFADLDLLNEAVLKRKQHGSIFNIKGNENLFNRLVKEKVVCSQRGDGIRLSFHFYNTESDVDKIIKILKTGP